MPTCLVGPACLFGTWKYLYFHEISYHNCAKMEEIWRNISRKCLFRKYFATLRMVWNELGNGLAILFRWHYNALPYQSMWLWQQATIELCTYDVLRTTKDFHYVEVLIWYIGQVISYQVQISIWFLLQDYNFSFQSRQKINCNRFMKLLSKNNEHLHLREIFLQF